MPAIANRPNKISIKTIRLFKMSGSKKAVKNPEAEMHTTAIDTFPYFTLP